jgi:flavin reductase (DIM6/NTAB) family NADH-FMN oxidoreductase RutF
MKHFSREDIKKLPSLERRALVNGIAGVKSLNLLGTISEEGKYNLAVFNSIVHIGSQPPMLGFILRPTTVERHTYDNMISTKKFTVNQVNTSIYKQAHQTAANYEQGISEFDEAGLTPQILQPYDVPFVQESKIKLACEYNNEYFIQENGCRLIIANIIDIYADEQIIEKNGFVNHDRAETSGAIGLDAYVSLKLLDRLDYARPQQEIKSILTDGTS